MLAPNRSHWGVDQWVAFLKDKDIPIMPGSRMILMVMGESQGDEMAPKDLARVLTGDPLLAIRLLRAAEHHRSRNLGRESTTPLAAIMQTGLDGLLALVKKSPLCDDSIQGLAECAFRAATASYLARRWAAGRADVSPEEVALAALLADIGEMMLWHFASDIPAAVQEELRTGRAMRGIQAQQQVAGFTFKSLSLALATAWELPPLISLLIRGVDFFWGEISLISCS